MKKYANLLKYEMKNLLRDRMNFTMFVYPFFMLLMAVFLFPLLFEMESVEGQGIEVTILVFMITIVGFGYIIASALLGFSLLDNKDEDTLQTIAVTPIAKDGYVKFKLIYTYVISIFSTIVLLGGMKILASDEYVLQMGEVTIRLLDNISYLDILIYAVSSSLIVPAIGLLIAGFAKNKIEGFAYMKSTGILALIPLLVILEAFHGMKQYLLSIFPNFWATQGIILKMLPEFPILSSTSNLSYYWYMIIGAVVSAIYSIVMYKFFMKKGSV